MMFPYSAPPPPTRNKPQRPVGVPADVADLMSSTRILMGIVERKLISAKGAKGKAHGAKEKPG